MLVSWKLQMRQLASFVGSTESFFRAKGFFELQRFQFLITWKRRGESSMRERNGMWKWVFKPAFKFPLFQSF